MVFLAFFVLLVSLGVSAGLFVWNQKIIIQKHDLEADLKNLDQRIDALRHEKDILMTRLVLAESRVQESIGEKPENLSANRPAQPEKKGVGSNPDEPIQQAAKKTEPSKPEPVKPEQSSQPNDSNLSVAIENFLISNQSDTDRIGIQFKIKNTSPHSQRVSGHTIVVLKGDQTNWLPIPWMPLEDGRPSGRQRGHSFGINYFKTMRLTAKSPKFPEKYQTASVYVFTRKGELLLEERFPIQLPPNRIKDTEPAPALHTIPEESTPLSPESPSDPGTSAPPSWDALKESVDDKSSE